MLPSCQACRRILERGDVCNTACSECANWDYQSLLLQYLPPEDFPLEQIANADNEQLWPWKISFHCLREAVQKALDKYADGTWSVHVVTSYLSVHGLNSDVICMIIDSVDNEEDWVAPSMWSQVSDITDMVDVVMHMLGLGVAKACNKDVVRSWLTQRKVFSSFNRSMAGKLESVKLLHLGWCKALSTGKEGKMGGWVSENHFALVRLSRWYYVDVFTLVEDAPYEPPNKLIV